MTLISCRFMRLDTEKAQKGAYAGALVCTDPERHGEFCMINWENDICPCRGEIL